MRTCNISTTLYQFTAWSLPTSGSDLDFGLCTDDLMRFGSIEGDYWGFGLILYRFLLLRTLERDDSILHLPRELWVHTLSCGVQNSKVVPKIPSPYIPSTLFNILLLRVSRICEYDGTVAHVIPFLV